MGRPSKYNEEIADSICDQIAVGHSLLKICGDSAFPSERAVYRWLEVHEEFRQRYARARELQADHYAAEIIDLADTSVEARKTKIKADGSEEIEISDAVERTRLRIDARKWYASKLAPKKYGDKVQQEISGADGKPIEAAITVTFVPTNHTES